MKRTVRLRVFAAVAGVLLGASAASAQGLVNTAWPALSPTQNFGFDQVNNASLAVSFAIPVMARQGRGISLSANLIYNSQVYSPLDPWGDSTGIWEPGPGDYGWNAPLLGQIGEGSGYMGTCGYPVYDEYGDYLGDDGSVLLYYLQFYFTDSGGATHAFPGAWYSGSNDPATDCPTPSDAYQSLASDNSGYTLNVDGSGIPTVVSVPGTTVGVWGRAIDRNGNEITASAGYCSGEGDPIAGCAGSEQTFWNYYDTLSPSTPALTVITSSVLPGYTPTVYTYPGVGGHLLTVTEQFTSEPVATDFGCSGVSEWDNYGSNAYLPTEIDLPDGTKYTFSYAGNGLLSGVTLPTGGSIAYSRGSSCTGGLTYFGQTLARSDPSNSADTWYWGITSDPPYLQAADVTDPNGNVAYIYFNDDGLVASTSAFAVPGYGAATTQYFCYNGATLSGGSCSSIPTGAITQLQTYTVIGNTGQTSSSNVDLDGYGNPTEEDDYDWGTGGSYGALLSKTLTTYNGNEFPTNVTVEAPLGTSMYTTAETAYTYDGSGVTASGDSQLASVSGARNNPTAVQRWTNSTSSLTQSFSYFDNGQVKTAGDTSGTTTYTYGACNDAFPTAVQGPVAALTGSMAWDCNGGVETSQTNANGGTTSYAYADPAYLWRVTSVVDPAGNSASYTYTNASGSVSASVEAAMTFNAGNSTSDALTTFDGLGRPYLNQTRQGPGSTSFDSVETQYDYWGRAYGVSAPYTAAAGSASGSSFTTASFDAAGRVVEVEDGGGGTTAYTYTGNDVLATVSAPSGENPKKRQMEYDGIGRLTSVCEVVTNTTVEPGSGTCGQTNSAQGYWTTYARSPSSTASYNLATVTQNAQAGSGGDETRTLFYDLLNRLIGESNPESGWTYYTYDTETGSCNLSSAGDMVKRVDAVGNVTCYAHDAAHRLTDVTYPTGSYATATAAKHFVYDAATVNAAAMANAAGRLAEAYTGSSGSKATDLGFSFDALGNSAGVYEATPHSGGYYQAAAGYWPNGMLNTLSGLGLPTLTYGAEGEGRTGTVSASSGQNPVTAVTYGAYGPTAVTLGSGDSDGFSFDASTGRMTQYQYTVNGQTDTGALGWNANGSLASLGITDNISGTADTQLCDYGYDDLARVNSAACGSVWNQTFSLDAFGNLAKSATAGTTFAASYNLNNQISEVGSFAPAYDANGNLEDDPISGTTGVYTWDADGRPATVAGVTLVKDALDRVVEEQNGSVDTEIVYGPNGGKMAEMNGTTLIEAWAPLPSGGQAVFTGTSGVAAYQHADWLGSSRLTSSAGQAMLASQAYAPYGEPYAMAGTADLSFTGQRQDTVTGSGSSLYDFLLREQSPTQGRWLSPDPGGAGATDINDPQSLNRYGYVRNSPTGTVDPMGLCGAVIAGSTESPNSPDVEQETAFANSIGANLAFPFAGQNLRQSLASIEYAALGGFNAAVATAQVAIQNSAQQSGGASFPVYVFSGGAQAAVSALHNLPQNIQNEAVLIAISPGMGLAVGLGPAPQMPGFAMDVAGGLGLEDNLVGATAELNGAIANYSTNCYHGSNCIISHSFGFLSSFAGPACPVTSTFVAGNGGGGGGGGGFGGGGGGGINWSAWDSVFTSWMNSIIVTQVSTRIIYPPPKKY